MRKLGKIEMVMEVSEKRDNDGARIICWRHFLPIYYMVMS